MAAVALWITVARGALHADSSTLSNAVRFAVLAIVFQTAHFAEEAATGLNHRLPELFDLAPMSMEAFVTINAVALVIWAIAVVALALRSSAALFPLWFLGVASASNAVLHPALSMATGGYFPGLVTSLFMGASGFLLLRSLARITHH